MKEFLWFFRSGKTDDEKTYFKDFIILFSIVFIFGISISILKAIYFDINMIDKEDFEKLTLKTFVSYVLIIPIIEEIIFRSPLLIPKSKIYSILINIVLIISSLLYMENEYLQITTVGLTFILEIIYLKSNRWSTLINNLIKKNYLILVILSSVSFGLLHMWNYEKIDFFSFLSVIGRIVAGFYFAFIATKYNLKASCLMHGVNNTIPFIILLLVEK